MFLIRDFWALILLLIFGFSPGARAAVGNITSYLWLAARNAATHLWNSGGRPLMEWTVGVLVVTVLTAWFGIWWFPARVVAPLLLIIWLFLIRAGVNTTIRAIETASVAVLEPLVRAIKGLVVEETTPGATASAALPEAEVEEARKSLVEALQAGVRPLTWLVVCAALWGIQIIVFPHISGTTGLLVIFVIVALNLLGSLLGRVSRLPERAAQFFVLIAIIVFAIELPLRNTLPGAATLQLLKQVNRKITASVWKRTAEQAFQEAVEMRQAEIQEELTGDFKNKTIPQFWKVFPLQRNHTHAIVWSEDGKKEDKLPVSTLAYLEEEDVTRPADMPKVPGKLNKIRLYDKSTEVYIIRATDGYKIANPFSF